jgi:type II secretory ATPase GspE/PulE/Tfp pilus assembly ATPase PilB-like protein
VEVAVEGVAQSQVNPAVDFDMATGLRGLLRLDPEVILIGEMRDRATAEIALQAALTGQLVITTFHAGDCRDAINRLTDIGIPSYAVRNAIRLVVAQRLLRKLCRCARPGDADLDALPLGISVPQCRVPDGCDDCHQTGYLGRTLIAEFQTLSGSDDDSLRLPVGGLWQSARALVENGTTSAAEVIRVLGLRPA